MAWTQSPSNWVGGDILTAAEMNRHIRDYTEAFSKAQSDPIGQMIRERVKEIRAAIPTEESS